jgi:hypothetical protein
MRFSTATSTDASITSISSVSAASIAACSAAYRLLSARITVNVLL